MDLLGGGGWIDLLSKVAACWRPDYLLDSDTCSSCPRLDLGLERSRMGIYDDTKDLRDKARSSRRYEGLGSDLPGVAKGTYLA